MSSRSHRVIEFHVYELSLGAATGKADWDVLEVWLREDQIALFRMESDVTLPNPPGCFFKNCINGPRTRGHAAAFQARLGWPSLETDEEKGWKPLFLH